jgi:acyl-CoA synthetase (AMP-forming)/AMP-acid ligase II
VVGIPHPKWPEVPKAFVALQKGQQLTTEQIIDHCSKGPAKFKAPKEMEFIDILPRNPSGKVLKRGLGERSKKIGSEGRDDGPYIQGKEFDG